ncbi:protein yippee-like 2 isoform X2 [Manis javanica]|uniref:protein yippee-like 2 isoform X2 n=1 Tax=Manis javanica TaxID=9974 RepID=UPI003C6D6CFE
MVKMTRSKTFQAYLPSCHRTYSCIHCRAHLANHDELISKARLFSGDKYRIPRIADHPAQPLSREQATGDPGTTSLGLHCTNAGHLYLTPLSCTPDIRCSVAPRGVAGRKPNLD